MMMSPLPELRVLDMQASKVNYPGVLVPVYLHEQTSKPQSLLFLDVQHDSIVLGAAGPWNAQLGTVGSHPAIASDPYWATYLIDTRKDRICMVSMVGSHHYLHAHSALEHQSSSNVSQFTYHHLHLKVNSDDVAIVVSDVTRDDMPSLEAVKAAQSLLMSTDLPTTTFQQAYTAFSTKMGLGDVGDIDHLYLVSANILDSLCAYFKGKAVNDVKYITGKTQDHRTFEMLAVSGGGRFDRERLLFVSFDGPDSFVACDHIEHLRRHLDCNAFKMNVGEEINVSSLAKLSTLFSNRQTAADFAKLFDGDKALSIKLHVRIY